MTDSEARAELERRIMLLEATQVLAGVRTPYVTGLHALFHDALCMYEVNAYQWSAGSTAPYWYRVDDDWWLEARCSVATWQTDGRFVFRVGDHQNGFKRQMSAQVAAAEMYRETARDPLRALRLLDRVRDASEQLLEQVQRQVQHTGTP